MRICAVIVTYNRPELLIRCVAAVVKQQLKPEAIIVVDNCSHIPALEVLRLYEKELQIFRFKENTGGAGGFYFGMAEAFRQGYDAAWLMDDDGVPFESCLTNLVEVTKRAMTGISNPLVVNEKNSKELVFGLNISGRVVSSTEEAAASANSDGVIDGAINPFNGTLIVREAYDLLGDIKFECFIWGDEEEYFARAMASNIRVGTVVSARHYHPATNGKTMMFGLRQSQLKICPPDRSHFHFRNVGFLKAHYRGIGASVYHGLNYFAFLLKTRQLSESLKFVCYYIDGALNLYMLKPSRSTLRRLLGQVIRTNNAATTEPMNGD